MSLETYRTKIHNQHDWTNRALANRCRPRVSLEDFTKTPLADVLPSWRDEHVAYARARHERAQGLWNLPASCRSLAQRLAARMYGWTGYLWTALDAIARRESSWNPCRHYPSSTNCAYAGPSACAIPQAVPCSKLLAWCGASTIGSCTGRRQIVWMLRYIAGRYGSPSVALANGSTY